MRKSNYLLLTGLIISINILAQELKTPAEQTNFQKVSSYTELSDFVMQLDKASDLLSVEVIGQSAENRNLYALKFSSTEFGKDPSKIKVLFFAQQHGNEQSGKEGALLLAASLLKPENRYLFDRIDFALIPQMNPDGAEANKRRNGNDADLNRNHMIMTEPETQALHKFFDKYLFEASMDVHEYSPFGEDWIAVGYRKNAQVTLGTTTNVNVSQDIRDYSNQVAFPFVMDFLKNHGYSSFVYCPGGPPGVDYIRHSTFDINDGRQSLGIQNTFSFIQEGMNGTDTYIENLSVRAASQMTGMRGMLEFIYRNSSKIKSMVAAGRKQLLNPGIKEKVSIQSDHFSNGKSLQLPVLSYSTNSDTVVEVKDYRPVVKSILDVEKPLGYLIPRSNAELMNWINLQSLIFTDFKPSGRQTFKQYFVNSIDSIDFERDIIVNPKVEVREVKSPAALEYVFVPIKQLKGNMIIQALEPQSELGLVTYKSYAHLLKEGSVFPVIRVENKAK